MIHGSDHKSFPLREILRNLITNPLIIACIVGILYALLRLPVPVMLDRTLRMVAWSATAAGRRPPGGWPTGATFVRTYIRIFIASRAMHRSVSHHTSRKPFTVFSGPITPGTGTSDRRR